jgi:hypothetical protein
MSLLHAALPSAWLRKLFPLCRNLHNGKTHLSQACDPSIVRELAKALECEADGMELAATDPKEEYDIW